MKRPKPQTVLKAFDIVRNILGTQRYDHEIAREVRASKTTVRRYRRLISEKQIDTEALEAMHPDELYRLLNPKAVRRRSSKRLPDWEYVAAELTRKNVTLRLLWREYREPDPTSAYSYTQFAHLHGRHVARDPVMRQHHEPGEAIQEDYSGDGLTYLDPRTGELHRPQLFVATTPASGLLFGTFRATQRIGHFIESHGQMFDFFGGVPATLVTDNLKAAVIQGGPDPWTQPDFQDCCRHYGTLPLSARPKQPRDKAAVESGVNIIQKSVLAALRNEVFHSLDELNAAFAAKLEELNNTPMQEYKESRRQRFERLERHRLQPLPATRYTFHEYIEILRVPKDYHVPVHGHHYSVPHQLIGARVDARVSATTVEILHLRRVVATHAVSEVIGGHTTDPDHQPAAHRFQAERHPQGFMTWAEREGGSLLELVREIFQRAPFPHAVLRPFDRLRSLVHKRGIEAVQIACQKALDMKSPTVTSVNLCLAMETRQPSPSAPRRMTHNERSSETSPHDSASSGTNRDTVE